MEPTTNDVAAVQTHIGETPAPQMQPETPTPQPAPQSQPAQQESQQPQSPQPPTDPFAAFTQTAQPAEPAAPSEPVAPTEPAPQQTQQATEPAQQPTQQPAQEVNPADDYQTYEEYMNSVIAGIPKAPEAPSPENINPDDPAAIKGFFDDLMKTAAAQAKAEMMQSNAIQQSEKRLWDAAMDKYGTLRTNKDLRDMVHNIRMANFQRGVAMTPTQAAEKLLGALRSQYNKGVADNQVVTTIEQVQPQGGQSGAPVRTSLDGKSAIESLQSGGETALANMLDQEIKAGRL